MTYLTAIVMCLDKTTGELTGKKYHNISDRQQDIDKFCKTMKAKFPAATHVNFYRSNRTLFQQIKFKSPA